MNDKIYAVDKPLLGMWSVGLWEVGMSEAGIPPPAPTLLSSFLLIDTPSPHPPLLGWIPVWSYRWVVPWPQTTPGLGEHWKGPS